MPAKPKLGQNFLTDAQAAERIVASLGDCSSQTVIEIGPGRGAVTLSLAARAKHVLAIELDRELATRLSAGLDQDRVTVIPQDVLNFDFAAAAGSAGARLLVIGNLPYYITSPILRKLARSHAVIDRAVVMMQREVADRVAAEPGSRDYGLLSVTTQLYGPVEKLFTLPPGAFSPPPKVHSTVVRWRFAPRFEELGLAESEFLGFLRSAFRQKRKTLANNLRADGVSPALITNALLAAGIAPQARAESLPIETLAALSKSLQEAPRRAKSL
jgi:16S rRNA (adenine1518-N6/adenine1519-N6)-dimethyltransferase